MKAIGYSLPFIFLVGGVAGLIGLSALKKEPAKKQPTEQSALVQVGSVEACEDGFKITVDGEVTPFREISLSSEAAGRIASKSDSAFAGNYVRKGDVLYTIDPRDYELEVRRLKETVKQAGSSIEELDVEKSNTEETVAIAEQQVQLARNELKRYQDLKSKNATSTSLLEKSRQAELQALNSLQTLKNQVTLIKARRNRLMQERERANTSLDQAELNLARTQMVSPIDGVVIQDFAEQDDFVQKGTRLIQLEDTSKVEVRFSMRMDQLRWLWLNEENTSAEPTAYTYNLPNVPVEIRVDLDGNEFTWPAKLSRYDGAGINAGTRTVPVIAVVENPRAVKMTKKSDIVGLAAPPALLRGSYVSVDIPVGKGMNLVAIPSTAFQPDKTVWVNENGKLAIHPVKVAYSDDDQVIVMADPNKLAVGDSVIVSPLPVAEPGMAIRVAGEAQPPTTATASDKKEAVR